MMLKNGEVIFIVSRRLFEKDLRRHFVGTIEEANEMTVRVKGYAFVYDDSSATFIKREGVRTRIFSLTDAVNIINLLPVETRVAEIIYEMNDKHQRFITDGKLFKMNISEFSANF